MVLFLLTLSFFIYPCISKDYCSPQYCNNSKEHVLCKFKVTGYASNCIGYEKLINTERERQDVLNKINSRRNKVASGEVRSLPAAGNMEKLVWNKELELSAQRWADQCVKSTKSGSYDIADSCRDLENISVGQTIATIYGESPGLTITSLIDVWYMELLNLNASILPHYLPSSTKGLHHDYFTQLIWGDTNQVGCGAIKFKEINMDFQMYQNRTIHRMVCNFAPAGNRIDQSVYSFDEPCSQCSHERNCDFEYNFLCTPSLSTVANDDDEKTEHAHLFNYIISKNLKNSSGLTKVDRLGLQTNKDNSLLISEYVADNDTKLDIFSDLFELTKPTDIKTETTTKCKEVLAVDEFIELLKNKLRNDHILRELLLPTTKLPNVEPMFSDRTVAAIINQLYSKKEIPTTSKSTKSDNLNSTLLVDLVEAVIFRHSGKYSSTEDTQIGTQNAPDVRPVKIQAELGEVKSNKEFTGHYFFPEEEEQTESEVSDLYDEAENIPITEISLEIEELRRNSATKDFLEEILESDFNTDSTVRVNVLPTIQNFNGNYPNSLCNKSNRLNENISTMIKYKRLKRNQNVEFSINYYDLLKKIASDLRLLKLQERFYCAHNCIDILSANFWLLNMLQVVVIWIISKLNI